MIICEECGAAYEPMTDAYKCPECGASNYPEAEVSVETISHFAGPRMDICGRIVQRCAVCGAKLCDSLNTAGPLNPDGTQPPFPTFAEGAIVQVEAGNPTRLSVLPDSDRLPPDACVDFI